MLDLTFMAQWLTAGAGVYVVCAAIILWALGSLLVLKLRLSPLVRRVKQGTALLKETEGEEGFAEGFEEFELKIADNRVLQHAWSEFSETLIVDPDLEPLAIRNTRSVGEYFNRNTVAGAAVNLRFYGALPNFLTGMGILGTFVGLVAGIYLAAGGLGSADTAEVKRALQSLLNGASLAFLTSITGLVTSILFSVTEKHWIHGLDSCLREWRVALDDRLLRVTAETISIEQLQESKRQTEQLAAFNNDLAFQIADAFQDKMSNTLGPIMERLLESVEGLRNDQQQKDDSALHAMLEKFSESLSGSAGQELSMLGSTLDKLNSRLEAQVAAMGQRQDEMIEASKASSDELRTILSGGLAEMQKGIEDALGRAGEKLVAILTEMDKSLDRAAQVSGEYANVLDKTGTALESMNTANTSLAATAEPLSQIAGDFKETSNSLLTVTERNREIATGIEQAIANITANQTELKQVWQQYESRFDLVDASLAKVVQEMITGLDSYTARVSEFVAGLDEHTSKIVQDLAGANSELTSSIEDLTDSLTRARRA